MGSLGSFGIIAGNALAILLAMPLVGIILREVYARYGVMSPSQAVVILGLVGGATQLTIQGVGSSRLELLSRSVNGLELVPAVLGSVLASGLISYLLLPPNPNPVTTALAQSGSLPS